MSTNMFAVQMNILPPMKYTSCCVISSRLGIWPFFRSLVLPASLVVAIFLPRSSPAGEASPLVLAERGPHHALWTRAVPEVGPGGRTIFRTNVVVELATGLSYAESGQWVGEWLS